MDLTRASCASNFNAGAKLPRDSDRCITRCRGCAIGAANAGKPAPVTLAQRISRILCGRCHRPASKLIDNRICVSCYNRHLEIYVGQDRRGKLTGFHASLRLHRLSAQVMDGDRPRTLMIKDVASENRLTGLACGEALLSMLRRCTGEALLTGRGLPVFA